MVSKMRKVKGQWGENLPVPYGEAQRKRQEEIDAEKEAQNRAYERANQLKRQRVATEAKQLEEARKQLSQQTNADARVQIQRLDEQEKQRKQAEKELVKKQKAQERIDKAGGVVYVKAKRKHFKYKRKHQVIKWKVEEETPKAFRRKKGKVGTSSVGNVIHSLLYPVKPKKKGRW